MHICVHACVCACMRAHVRTYVYPYVCTLCLIVCVNPRVCASMCLHVCKCACIPMYLCSECDGDRTRKKHASPPLTCTFDDNSQLSVNLCLQHRTHAQAHHAATSVSCHPSPSLATVVRVQLAWHSPVTAAVVSHVSVMLVSHKKIPHYKYVISEVIHNSNV